jgi:hypothetical protein
MMMMIIIIIIHHQGCRCCHHHHLKRQKGSSTREGKTRPGGLFTQNAMTCTPDQFIATDDNITALKECCFQPTTWQSLVYLGEERSQGLQFITNTERLSQTVKKVSLKTVLCVPGRRQITGFFCETC